MINIKDLYKSYGKFKVLKNINLNFAKEKVIALMGPNGSGKTTLLKSILGLVIPEKGEITVSGINIKNNFLYRDKIGYMPQTAFFPDNLRAKDIVNIITDIRGKEKAVDFDLYKLFKIEQFENKKISSLSQGMKQRLSGVIAFLFDSDIIILDEPTAGLDPASAEFMKNKILEGKDRNKLILITTHIVNEVQELADRLIFMLDGEIHFDYEVEPGTEGIKITESISKLFAKYEFQ